MLDREQLPVRIELCIHRYEVVIRVMVLWTISLVVVGQAVHYSVVGTIHMLDGKIEAEDVLPPPCLSTRQVWLSLKVFEALVTHDYDGFLS